MAPEDMASSAILLQASGHVSMVSMRNSFKEFVTQELTVCAIQARMYPIFDFRNSTSGNTRLGEKSIAWISLLNPL